MADSFTFCLTTFFMVKPKLCLVMRCIIYEADYCMNLSFSVLKCNNTYFSCWKRYFSTYFWCFMICWCLECCESCHCVTIVCVSLPDSVVSEIGSHLVEQYLSVVPAEQFERIYRKHFCGHFVEMANHPLANFVLQKLILFTHTQEQVRCIFEKTV